MYDSKEFLPIGLTSAYIIMVKVDKNKAQIFTIGIIIKAQQNSLCYLSAK